MYRRKEKYKTEKEKREAIMANPLEIRNIPNASEKLKRLAVERKPSVILEIPNASEKLKRLAVEGYPGIIFSLCNPSEELIKLAVELDPGGIPYIISTTPAKKSLIMYIKTIGKYWMKRSFSRRLEKPRNDEDQGKTTGKSRILI